MLYSNLSNETRSNTSAGSASTDGPGFVELVEFAFLFLRRQYVPIIVATIFALSVSVIYLGVTPPTYTGQVQVLLENSKAQFVQQQSLLAEQIFDHNQIKSQLQIIRSRNIAAAVIKEMNLADDPDFDGTMGWFWKRSGVSLTAPAKRMLTGASSEPSQSIIRAFQNRLQAIQIGSSNVLEISFNSSDAEQSARIANAVADAYIKDQIKAKFDASRRAITWLQDRLRDLGDRALAAERAVQNYKTEKNIVSSGGTPLDERQVADINGRLVAARSKTSDALTQLNRYEAVLRANSKQPLAIGTLDATGSEALNSPIINNLREQYLELGRRESEYSNRFGQDHLAVINMQRRMRGLRASILDEVRQLTETSRSDLEVARLREQALEKQLEQAVSMSHATNSAEVTLHELESQAKNYRSLYDTLLQRYTGAVQQESFPISEARVISPALTPDGKSKPKTPLILALGAAGGLSLGVAIGLFRHLMSRGFRTSDDVTTALQLSCLSQVPLLSAPKTLSALAPRRNDANFFNNTSTNQGSRKSSSVNMPLSRFTESIRTIRLEIDLKLSERSSKVIGVTSALPNEGKTTIATSLAHLIGKGRKRVILVDCDLRNPSLSVNIAPNAAGLIEVIHGESSLEEVICGHSATKLDFLPAGCRRPLGEIGELLSADAAKSLFDQLRATYDYVIVDLPPLAPVADVRAIGSLIDGFVFVIEWGQTKVNVVQHALYGAPEVYENLIGTVLNKIDLREIAHYASHWKDCYNDDYYGRSDGADGGLISSLSFECGFEVPGGKDV